MRRTTCATRWPLTAAIGMLLLLGCGDRARDAGTGDGADSTRPTAAASERRVTSADWEAAWTRGGEAEDTLLLMPTQLAADSAHVFVLDPGGPRVVALRARDGRVAWSYDRRGAGPGELRHPTAIAASGTGELLVLDEHNQRVTVIGADGRFARSIPLRGAIGFESLCGLAGGEVLLKRSGRESAFIRLARDGAAIEATDLPWRENGAVWSAQWAGRLAGDGDANGCVLALAHGLGFTRYDSAGPHLPVAYVEQFGLPAVDVEQRREGAQLTVTQRIVGDRAAAIDAGVASAKLYVLFGGASGFAHGVIDVYALPSGAYERSYSYSAGIERIAVAGGMLYALGREEDVPQLVAYRTGWPASVASAAAAGTRGGTRGTAR